MKEESIGAPVDASVDAEECVKHWMLIVLLAPQLLACSRDPQLDLKNVEQFRTEQDKAKSGPDHEALRQRYFRLYTEHPDNPMIAYLWARMNDTDPVLQEKIATEAIKQHDDFAWNYYLLRMLRGNQDDLPGALEFAKKAAALEPVNLLFKEEVDGISLFLRYGLDKQDRPSAGSRGVSYRGRATRREVDYQEFKDIQDAKFRDGTVSESTIESALLCTNPFRVVKRCLRVFWPNDGIGHMNAFGDRWISTWDRVPFKAADIKKNEVLEVKGDVIRGDNGEPMLLATAVSEARLP